MEIIMEEDKHDLLIEVQQQVICVAVFVTD